MLNCSGGLHARHTRSRLLTTQRVRSENNLHSKVRIFQVKIKKIRIFSGLKYAEQACKLKPTHFRALKWAAVMTGAATDFASGTKEKIQQGFTFKVRLLLI